MAEPSTVECPGCFQQKESEVATCPRCGYNSNAPRSLSLLPVQTQLKRYLIGEKLGQGGFGITYRGFDLKLKMRVAIKEYYPSDFVGRSVDRKTLMLISPENDALFKYGLQAFLNEAHTLAQLQHPNLVRVLNLFEMNGTAYLVMDYYEGETLHDYLARQPDKKLPWQQAVNLLLPVLDGLREVHRNGFMHRDVKPRNLYLTQRGQLVLLDFGAARQVVSDRTRSLAIYSSGYAAYEQHVQGEQGPWTDVYGAAATLYFALTGHVPPPAPDRMKKDPRKPARHFSPGLPPALDNVLNRALMVEPKKRLQTIEEFEQQLRAVLKQEDKPRSEPSREVKPGSFRLWAMLGSLLLAILVAGLIGKVFPSSKPPDDPTRAPPPAAVVHIVEPPPPVVTTPPPPPKREEPAIPPVVAPVPQTQPVEPIIPSVAEPKPPPVSEAPPVAEPAPAPNPNPERTYLTVKTEPLGAQVRIMNIGPAYQDGIELIPGGFDIEISAPGYQTYRGWHDLVVGVQELKIALQAETKPPPPAGFEVFHDKLLDGGDGPAMVVIPAGEFWMGSPESEAGRGSDEKQHKVMVQRFAIGQYEVTFDEYDRFCDATKRKKPSDKDWGRGRRPVINVSWADATAYANWLSAQTDQSYQLPTEAEWEYAARAGTKTAYWWGTSVRGKRANCNGCGSQWDNQKTALVGSFAANPWGLYDTVGNVWEWTCSLYDENYGGAEGKCIYTASVPSIFD